MTDPRNVHPLAPRPGTAEEGPGETANDPQAVRLRSGIELGAMRYVLGVGLVLALLALVAAWLFGYLPVGR